MPATIMTSNRVNPALRDILVFISNLPVLAARTRLLVSYSHAFRVTARRFTEHKVAAIAASGNPGGMRERAQGITRAGQKKLLHALRVRYQRGIISGICV